MKHLLQIGVVCGVYWVSQCIEHVLPFAFPASVISLLLLLALLLVRVLKAGHIQNVADFLTGNMSFFFLPATVSIMNYVDTIFENAGAFFTICVVSMITTFAATAGTVVLTRRLLRKGEGEAE
ncbi:CidA/LrgA family protein [Dysosmobacter sp.]|uniref:CidA/LrgA family protein n=1 Tax=Dysosmobacter sp. TaxID=2591382 RepID=UPI002A8AA321|nr:CidA/LrgA family protein [Dysosmobacter sp.]MDY3985284.1 CidA/LrgA family protein [Dysosmobacter sp.]